MSDSPVLADLGDSTIEMLGNLLGASAYRAGDRIAEYRDLLRTLFTIHTARDAARDPRCLICRDSSGRPAPWPCTTQLLIDASTGTRDTPIEDIILMRNAGRELNGQRPLPDSGIRRELTPLLKILHEKHGFDWADPERLPK